MAYKNFRCTEIIEEIGEELRRVRKQKKLTISHVAEQVSAASGLPVSNTLLGRIETGERRIDDEIMEAEGCPGKQPEMKNRKTGALH